LGCRPSQKRRILPGRQGVNTIPGISKTNQEKLEAQGIYTVQALAALSDDSINVLSAKPESKFTKTILQKFHNYSKTSKHAIKPDDLIWTTDKPTIHIFPYTVK
jgi:predicted RecB family nuclease